MPRPIFRKEALERLASPEQLDQLLPLTSPRSWLALAALGLLLLMALAWGFFGTISSTVQGQGVLIRRGGVRPLGAPAAGVVKRMRVRVGESVAKDQELILLSPSGPGAPAPVAVRSPCAARVLGEPVEEGTPVEKGATLLLLDPVEEPMRALVYLPVGEGYQVQPGMAVRVSPAPAGRSEFGYLLGRVTSAAKFPTTRAEMKHHMDNEDLAEHLAAAGPCLEVIVDLTQDADAPSGYRWSSARGWPLALHSGTPCQALITVGELRPVQLAMPSLRGLLGS